MSEFIPFMPENDTTEERFFWDNVIRSLDMLNDIEEEINVVEELEGLQNKGREDALTLLFNYATQVTVPKGESSKLKEVFSFLVKEGFLDGEEFSGDYS
jgi:hypothetical protein